MDLKNKIEYKDNGEYVEMKLDLFVCMPDKFKELVDNIIKVTPQEENY